MKLGLKKAHRAESTSSKRKNRLKIVWLLLENGILVQPMLNFPELNQDSFLYRILIVKCEVKSSLKIFELFEDGFDRALPKLRENERLDD